jgi:translocation and assembly module TamB
VECRFGANAPPAALGGAISRFINRYFDQMEESEAPEGHVQASGRLDIRQTRLLTEVLVPGLTQLETASATFDFDEATQRFQLRVDAPFIEYEGNHLHGFQLRSQANRDSLGFSLGFEQLSSGSVHIYKTHLQGQAADNHLLLDLDMRDEKALPLFRVLTEVHTLGDSLTFHLVPKPFLLNAQEWGLHAENMLSYASGKLHAKQCRISRGRQEVSLHTQLEGIASPHVGLRFQAFDLSTITALINPQENPITGTLQGQLVVENPTTLPVATANLSILDLALLGQALGVLEVSAENTSAGNYQAEINLKGEGTHVELRGNYATTEEGVSANLGMNILRLDMDVLAGLSKGEIRDGAGAMKGYFQINYRPDLLHYRGNLRFEAAQFTVKALNSPLSLPSEEIRITQEALNFERFGLVDAAGNRMQLRGRILTPNLTQPEFDLELSAKNFQILNSSRADNDLFFGKALVDMELKITGNLETPRIEARGKMNRGSAITVIVPESELDVVEREGVVIMVNMKNPDDIITRTEEQAPTRGIQGYYIRALVKVDPATSLRILIDERSGDYLEIAGEADMSFDLNPNGQMSLSGVYELRSGVYEMSLYNIVKRKFELVPGSRITWSGDPVDAALDLTAKYRLRTSPAELMSEQLAGADASVRNRYRQELPFEVLLKIKGALLRPEISFGMDMPENQRGALGGNVYGRVQQLNNSESELTKQVFGLLVLGRFFPEGALSPQESEGTAAMARNSVSQALSGQLNTLSKKYVKGVELDMDLDSFTDYQTGAAADRTQLNVNVRKTLFGDRVVVQVGSQVDLEGRPDQQQQGAGDIIGDVSVEYLLSEDGRYRLRGFRKNQFEGLVEGQLITTGVAFLFNKEFNKWSEALKKQRKVASPPTEEGNPEDPTQKVGRKEEENR